MIRLYQENVLKQLNIEISDVSEGHFKLIAENFMQQDEFQMKILFDATNLHHSKSINRLFNTINIKFDFRFRFYM